MHAREMWGQSNATRERGVMAGMLGYARGRGMTRERRNGGEIGSNGDTRLCVKRGCGRRENGGNARLYTRKRER